MAMLLREGFQKPARGFSITLSLQEGYGGEGKVHNFQDVVNSLAFFARERDVEIGGTLREEKIFYAYRKLGGMVWATEPGVVISGLFPPNKFADGDDEKLVALIGELVEWLADRFNQISIHAEVCGLHCAWKREGQKTAHEIARDEMK